MKSKQFGKRDRQESATKRTEAQLAVYEQELVNDKGNKDLKKKIERAKTAIENTKKKIK
jgi:trimethylamine:corrinoid methyltransferase-like protein